MASFSLDEKLKRKELGLDMDQYDKYKNLGLENPSVQSPEQTPNNIGWASKYGIDDNPTVFEVAKAVEGNQGSGAAVTSAPRIGEPVQTTGTNNVIPTQPSGELAVQPPNTSGTTVTATALTGTEQNGRLDRQDSATNENRQQYLATLGADGNTNILASAPEAKGNRFTEKTVTPDIGPNDTLGPNDSNEPNDSKGPNDASAPNNTLGPNDSNGPNDTNGPNNTEPPVEDNKPPETSEEIDKKAAKDEAKIAEEKAQKEALEKVLKEEETVD